MTEVLLESPGLTVKYLPGQQYPLLAAADGKDIRTWGGVYASTLVVLFREWIVQGVAEKKIIPLLTDRSGL